MNDEDFLFALEAVIAQTGVEHYRHLCLTHDDPKIRASYRQFVIDTYLGVDRSAVEIGEGQIGDGPQSTPCCGGNPYGD